MYSLIDSVRHFFCVTPMWISIPLTVLAIILYIGVGKTVKFFLFTFFINFTKLRFIRLKNSSDKLEDSSDQKNQEISFSLIIAPAIIIITWPIILALIILIASFAITLILALIILILFLIVAIIQLVAHIASAIIIGVPAFIIFVIAIFVAIIIVFFSLFFTCSSAVTGIKIIIVDIPKTISNGFKKSSSKK